MRDVLIIVPCGLSKIWHRHPERGAVPAKDAYTGNLFKLNRKYAEKFGSEWMILSAKFGFIDPDFVISEPYDVTFSRPGTRPISACELKAQVNEIALNPNKLVVGLGGAAYRDAVQKAFDDTGMSLVFPFSGLPLGMMLQATKNALLSGNSGIEAARRGNV